MKLTRIIGVSITMLFAVGGVNAADQSSFAVLNGAQVEKLSVTTMDSTHGKHMSIKDAATESTIARTSGTNGKALDHHVTILVGGGAASITGLPCAVCAHDH